MFYPKYNINSSLLNNIVKIKNIVEELNDQKFPSIVLAKFEKDSYAISAFASTSIEGNPIPLTDVRKLLKSRPSKLRDTEKEVLNYNNALIYLNANIKHSGEITGKFICEVQALVAEGIMDKKNIGKMRKEHVVVNDPKKREIAYIAPNPEDVKDLMTELINFLRTEKNNVDPLILAGIFHKQFVVIHPFMDGNGRTARLITKYLLASMGLDTFKLFSFENYYNQNVSKYFLNVGVLGDYYDIKESTDFTAWLIYFTGGIIDELLRVQKLLISSAIGVRLEDYEEIIVDYVKKYGSISRREYRSITDRASSTQILDFKRLIEKEILIRENSGKATFYILKKDL